MIHSRFLVDLTTQGAIWSPIVISRKGRWPSCLHGELDIPVNAIHMVREPLQLLWSMWPDEKHDIHITEPAQRFVDCLC